MNKKTKRIIIITSIIFTLLILLIYSTSPNIMSYTSSTDITGKVTQKLTTCNWLCQIFHPNTQQAYFLLQSKQGGYKVGDTITIQESLSISKDICLVRGNLVSIQQIIYKDGAVYKKLPEMYHNYNVITSPFIIISPTSCPTTYSYQKTTTFTPTQTGTYTVKTLVVRAKDSPLNPIYVECSSHFGGDASNPACNLVVNSASSTPVTTPTIPTTNPPATTIPTTTPYSQYTNWCSYQSMELPLNQNKCFGTTKFVCGSTPTNFQVYYQSSECGYNTPTQDTNPPAIVTTIVTPEIPTTNVPGEVTTQTPTATAAVIGTQEKEYSTTTQIIFWIMITLIIGLVGFIIYKLGVAAKK